jgi:CRP-like cAMP-binding protein
MLTTIEKIFLLQDLDLFTQASADHLALLADLCEELRLNAGQSVFRAGDPSSQLYLLIQGKVRIENPSEGMLEVDSGAIGLWSCLAGRPHESTAGCVSEAQFLVIRGEDFLDVLMTEPGLGLAILQHHAAAHPG